jgi:hypothetical protein
VVSGSRRVVSRRTRRWRFSSALPNGPASWASRRDSQSHASTSNGATGRRGASASVSEPSERSGFTQHSLRVPVTVFIGVAGWSETTASDIPDLLEQADRAPLRAKRAGRNQVVCGAAKTSATS